MINTNTDWKVFLSYFPSNWERLARDTGALHRLRGFNDVESMLRTLLLHVACGYSLRETVAKAKLAGLSDVSDVTLMNRLRGSEAWFNELNRELMSEVKLSQPKILKDVTMRLIDGTMVKEPGVTGSQWRVHYSISLPDLRCDFFKLTEAVGVGTAESYSKIPISKGDCLMGDRGYSSANGIFYVHKNNGHVIVRFNPNGLNIYDEKHKKIDLLKELKDLEVGQYYEQIVLLKDPDSENSFIKARICSLRKSDDAARISLDKLIKTTRRKHNALPRESTCEYTKYFMVLTTLSAKKLSTSEVLEWYRLRWQIEISFKRLKQLVRFSHLPKTDDRSARAWIQAKLFVGLMTEKIIFTAKFVSPWGYETIK